MKLTLKSLRTLTGSFIVFISLQSEMDAAITLTIEGTPGSANFTISGSGTNTLFYNINQVLNPSFLYIPTDQSWQNPFLSTFGDILKDTPEYNLGATSGAVILSTAGSRSFSNSYTGLRLFAVLPDRFALILEYRTDLPSLSRGDSVTLSGTANFRLPSGTFDTMWNPGTYEVLPTPNGGSYTVQINLIPEPSSAFLIGLCTISVMTRRRRRLSFK